MDGSVLSSHSIEAMRRDVRLIEKMVRDPRYEEARYIFLMSAHPFISLVLNESIKCLGFRPGQLGLSGSALTRLSLSRNEVKILTHSTSIESQLSYAQALAEGYTSAFHGTHSHRRFAPLWKALQPDLGLYFLQGVYVTNTFTLHQDLGLTLDQIRQVVADEEVLGPILLQDGMAYGSLLRALHQSLQVEIGYPKSDPGQLAPFEGFRFRDVDSGKWLAESQTRLGGVGKSFAYLLLNVFSRIQVANQLASVFADDEWQELKVKLIYGFHGLDSMRKLISYESNHPSWSIEVRTSTRAVLGTPASKAIPKLRPLRNFAVHYGLNPEVLSVLGTDTSFNVLVEAMTGYESVRAVIDVLDQSLFELSVLLREFFDIGARMTRPL